MIVVYTALFGKYDTVLPALHKGNYILFTDQDITPEGWQVRKERPPHPDPRYASRYYFNQSCLNLPQADYTIMHGANAQLLMKPEKLVELLEPDYDIAAFAHPRRNCVYEEAEAVLRFKKDNPRTVNAQMARYRAAGYPERNGLTSCALLVRRNTLDLAEFERAWWDEVRCGSYRDQLSFDVVRWHLKAPIQILPGNAENNEIFKRRPHRK